jgi:ATP-dependent Clp protease ATP-binding subunit ClpA
MFERFTEKSIKVIMLAQEESRRQGHNFVGTEQLLLGLIGEGTGLAFKVLTSMGVTLRDARLEVERVIGRGTGFVSVEVPFTPRAKRILELSLDEARQLGHNYIGTEHLLLGLIRENDGVAVRVLENLGVVFLSKLRTQVIRTLGEDGDLDRGYRIRDDTSRTPSLDEFGTDLTQKAQASSLDPVIGRDNEIERVIQILGRRTKNNPILIGEPGVGKTSIAEGLAQLIVANDVADILENKRIVTLDIGLLVAGTKYRGEFEERLKKIMEEVHEDINIILVIDEVHTLVGAGAAEGAIDAANILKPALARGELQCIGATTIEEFRKHIEKDAALERRFQPVMVEEPTVAETEQILFGLKGRYETHHKLTYNDDSLHAAANLADQYITDRFLPDKAIDLIDESGSRVRLLNSKLPLGAKKEKASSLKSQSFEESLRSINKNEGRSNSSVDKYELDRELALIKNNLDIQVVPWEEDSGKRIISDGNAFDKVVDSARKNLDKDLSINKRVLVQQIVDIDENLDKYLIMTNESFGIELGLSKDTLDPLVDSLTQDLKTSGSPLDYPDTFLKSIDFVEPSRIVSLPGEARVSLAEEPKITRADLDEIDEVTKALVSRKAKLSTTCLQEICKLKLEEKARLLTKEAFERKKKKLFVTEDNIAEIVGAWTGIPVNKLSKTEAVKLMNMEKNLHEKIIGQNEAVVAISRAIRRARVGLKNPNRPIASFIFSGPTGVGKTELTKALATYFFGSVESMVRLDMSEFMERHTVSKLIGSPPGYVGYTEGGQLTEAVRRRPYCVVLFDEVEKAHPDIFNLLLQIFEDGRLTDSKGKTIDFKNTLLIMTSNIGSKVIEKKGTHGLGFEFTHDQTVSQYNRIKELVNEELKEFFRPEFLNRLDEIIVFRQLTREEVTRIADIMLTEVFQRVVKKGIALSITADFKEHLITAGFNPTYGARPLRRAVQRLLEDNLAEELLSGRVAEGESLVVDMDAQGDVVIMNCGKTNNVKTLLPGVLIPV